MTSVRSIQNQYRGINAHLHSYWQNQGGWDGFHTNHIADLMRLMRVPLIPLGYIAEIEQSLQIRHLDKPMGRPESDITIYDTIPSRSQNLATKLAEPAVAITEIMDLVEEFAQYRAIAIYPGNNSVEPVVWIELLSPSNKPGGQDASYYRNKRLKILQSNIVFVEIDYLHQSRPTFEHLSDYPAQQTASANSHAYRIVVVDPRPKLEAGLAYPYEFDVDQAIPVVKIPLQGDDVLEFDFQAAYNKTYTETMYGMQLVDYSELPIRFDRYSRSDQIKILSRMLAVLDAVRSGLDLEAETLLPTKQIELEEALTEIETWQR